MENIKYEKQEKKYIFYLLNYTQPFQYFKNLERSCQNLERTNILTIKKDLVKSC